jgi:hypothetical protein
METEGERERKREGEKCCDRPNRLRLNVCERERRREREREGKSCDRLRRSRRQGTAGAPHS